MIRRLEVAQCIGCGARSRGGECADGCVDVPLDLVDARALDELRRRVEALEVRVAALLELAHTVASDAAVSWPALRDRARAALRLTVPAASEIEVLDGWGCPRCGRVDAPQPCLGVCVFGPGVVTDAAEYRQGGIGRPSRSPRR